MGIVSNPINRLIVVCLIVVGATVLLALDFSPLGKAYLASSGPPDDSISNDCGDGMPCQCGDTLSSVHVMTYDVIDCPINGIRLAPYAALDCDGHRISGTGGGWGVWFLEGPVTIERCQIEGFTTGIRGTAAAIVRYNTLRNHLDFGAYFTSNANRIYGNRVEGNPIGLELHFGTQNNNLTNNTFQSNSLWGLRLYNSRNNIVNSNRFILNQYGLFVDGPSTLNNFSNNSFFNNAIASAYEDGNTYNNDWNPGNIGNYWTDIPSNPGFPSSYVIPGPGEGVDHFPITDGDGDGYPLWEDCRDDHPGINPGQRERCSNTVDDNCNGQVDEGCGRTGSPMMLKQVAP